MKNILKTHEATIGYTFNQSHQFKYTLKLVMGYDPTTTKGSFVYRINLFQIMESNEHIKVVNEEIFTSCMYYHTLNQFNKYVEQIKKGGISYNGKTWSDLQPS